MCPSIPHTVFTVSQSTTTILEEEYGPDPISDPAGQSEFVWASVADPPEEEEEEEEATDLQNRVDDLEAELSRVRDHRDRLAAKADRVENLERQVERLKNEKQTLIQARTESPQIVPVEESSTRQRRRKARLWTYLKRQLF